MLTARTGRVVAPTIGFRRSEFCESGCTNVEEACAACVGYTSWRQQRVEASEPRDDVARVVELSAASARALLGQQQLNENAGAITVPTRARSFAQPLN